MASTIILSDNGVSSGSAGLKETGGNDGVLILQTTTSGGTATTAVTIGTDQSVTVSGALTATGDVTLGDASSDVVTITGHVASSITIKGTSGGSTGGAGLLNLYRSDTSTSSGNWLGAVSFYGDDSTGTVPTAFATIVGVASGTHSAGSNPTDLTFSTTASGSETVTERARISSTGNLIFAGNSYTFSNTTSGGATVDAGVYYNGGSQYVGFFTAATERARIDSSGNLLVGTTATLAGSRMRILGSGNTGATYTFVVNNSDATICFAIEGGGGFYTGTATDSPYNATTASAANVFVASNGRLQRSTSSLKYKTEVKDAAHGLVEVMSLRAVTYKGKAENDGDKVFGGLVAEEVHEAGLTEFVQYAEDGTPDALAYGNMVSLAFKAIQEQQALITTLTERITALEAK